MEVPILKFAPAIAAGIVAIILGIAGQAILGGMLLLVAVGFVAIQSIKKTGETRAVDPREGLDPEGRSTLLRFRKIYAEIEELSSSVPKGSSTAILIAEASAEADRIMSQVAEELRSRRTLKRAISGLPIAQQELQHLVDQQNTAHSDDERASLEVAVQSKRSEISQYDVARQALQRLDENLARAESALGEMRARLKGGSATESAERASDLEIRDTISRMRAISDSVDESREFLNDES